MEKYYYSKSEHQVYTQMFKEKYERNGMLPGDIEEISKSEFLKQQEKIIIDS